MNSYDGRAVDLYMRSILDQDLDEHEVDNALTLLTTLTTIGEKDFPPDRTFIRVVRTRLLFHPEQQKVRGITIFTIKENEDVRSITLARADLADLQKAMNSLFHALGKGYILDES